MADDRQFDEADAAVAAFVRSSRARRWLATELSALTDDIKDVAGPATLKLLDAFADYRDSRPEDR